MSETGEIEATVEYVKRTIFTKRKEIFWFLFFLALCWLILQIKEIATILFLSYFISLLLDPILTKLQNRRVPRALSLIILAIIFLVFITTFMAVAIPAILDEYSSLVELFPNYLRELTEKINILSVKLFNRSTPFSPEDIWLRIREYSEHMGIEPIKNALSSLFNTMLSGYSLTLTFLNFILLPLFVFYISMDLKKIHIFIGRFLPVEWRQNTAQIGKEILSHIYVFFRGQLTICLILAVLYSLGLYLIGVPYSAAIGTISGIFSAVPYLGVTTGLTLSTIITLVNDPTFYSLLKVLLVFITVQIIEGTILTPKIIGETLGIHPLGVILVLFTAGKLLGLLGLILAIPTAAALRVIFKYILRSLN